MTKERLSPELMALRVARELRPGSFVNLGIGLPTLVSDYIREETGVFLQSENGFLGYGPRLSEGELDPDFINASGHYVERLPGCAFFSSVDAFGMIRGGHLDATVLGAFQVAENGDLANWMVASRGMGSVGGAMDLASGARQVIVVMEHTTRRGEPRLLHRCTYPLTAPGAAHLVVTDLGVVRVTAQGFCLEEIARGFSPAEVQALTEATLHLSPHLKEIEL